MLTELDGVDKKKSVFVIAATNRPDMIDPAMMRPGRLDKLLYVPLPDEPGRLEILQKATKKTPMLLDKSNEKNATSVVDLSVISSKTEGYTGADLGSL